MLPLEKVTDLELAHPAGATQSTRVEAASGLAILDRVVYVVADDEAYLAAFRDMGCQPGVAKPFLDVRVPRDDDERKKHKPDLESLTPLPAFGRFERGGLIALGSASGESRDRGAFAALAEDGSIEDVLQIDAKPLMEELGRRIPKLNLEGTAIAGEVFRLLQRGNDPEAKNAHIDLDLAQLLDAVADARPLRGELIVDIVEHDLGQLRGTKLCFSDADTLPDGRIAFSASAETETDEIDGVPVGSAVGIMETGGEVVYLEPVDAKTKVEGLAVVAEDGGISGYMVTDDDDPSNPTALLRVRLPLR